MVATAIAARLSPWDSAAVDSEPRLQILGPFACLSCLDTSAAGYHLLTIAPIDLAAHPMASGGW
jgi:hypothetical protein